MSLRITITSDAQEAAKRLDRFPILLRRALVKSMNEQNELAIGEITRNRLTGDGPFQVSEHKLGVVTKLLRASLNRGEPHSLTTLAVAKGDTVTSTIGTNVEYAGAHEFGFSGPVFVNSHIRRAHKRLKETITTKTGKTRRKFSKVGESIVTGHGRNVDIPARAPIKHGLEDYEPEYGRGISEAIVGAWNKAMGK